MVHSIYQLRSLILTDQIISRGTYFVVSLQFFYDIRCYSFLRTLDPLYSSKHNVIVTPDEKCGQKCEPQAHLLSCNFLY